MHTFASSVDRRVTNDGGPATLSRSGPQVLELKNVCKRFKSFTAVTDLSFSIQQGEICGLLGPNGLNGKESQGKNEAKELTQQGVHVTPLGLCKP